MVVEIQAIEEGEVVEVVGMGIINLLVIFALVLVTQLFSVIADTIELLLKLCRFRLYRVISRATSLVIHMAVVNTICRMVKQSDSLLVLTSQFTKSSFVYNSYVSVSENPCQSVAFNAVNAISCKTLTILPCKHFDVNTASLHPNKTATLWHSKLGHPNAQVLKQVLSKMHISCTVSDVKLCESCKYGKLHQLPFSSSISKTTAPLELMFLDIWGLSLIAYTNGHKYYIVFVDVLLDL
ncbi:hypothetical protein ACOSQ4_021368 [Xanthoceras sorbifolium]